VVLKTCRALVSLQGEGQFPASFVPGLRTDCRAISREAKRQPAEWGQSCSAENRSHSKTGRLQAGRKKGTGTGADRVWHALATALGANPALFKTSPWRGQGMAEIGRKAGDRHRWRANSAMERTATFARSAQAVARPRRAFCAAGLGDESPFSVRSAQRFQQSKAVAGSRRRSAGMRYACGAGGSSGANGPGQPPR
jgi:hypothetical protein